MTFQESENVEVKAIVVEDIKKEMIAFANCYGGKLFIGVQDDGTAIGVKDADGTVLQVSNMVRDAIKPERNRTTILYCEKGTSTGRCVCEAGIFIRSCDGYGNSPDD